MKKMKNKIFLMLFASIILLVAILMIQNVSAQRYGCCYKRFDGKYCEEGYVGIGFDCDSANFLGGNCTDSRNAAKCGLVTCSLFYDCMFNVKKGKCLYEHNGTVAKGDECVKECCGIAGRSYGIKTHRACKNIAFEKGFNESYIEFVSTADEHECAAHFEPTVKGCCMGVEGCKDTTREECSEKFHADVLCKKIPTKCQVSDIGLKCGKQPGNDNKVVFLDSAGGEEVKYSCSLPQYRCVECSEDVCDFEASANSGRTIVEYAEGYCADTSCKLTEIEEMGEMTAVKKGDLKQQEITKDGKIKVIEPASWTLQTGQSICYNFYGAVEKRKAVDQGWGDVMHMYGKSTGLQNHKLVCNYGKIQVIGLGADRKVLCKDDQSVYIAKKITNEWKKCQDCGKFDNRFLNVVGDFVAPGITAAWLGQAISEQCKEGDCRDMKSPEGESLCYYDYDMFKLPGSAPIGSCVPRFSPGTTEKCSACGGGGDSIWNICSEAECYALGNCQFKQHNLFRKTGVYLLSWIGLYGSNRLGLFYVEATFRTIDDYTKCQAECAAAAAATAGFALPPCEAKCHSEIPLNYVKNVGVSVGAAISGPVSFTASWLLKGTLGTIKGTIDGVMSGFNTVKSVLGIFKG